MASVVYHEHPGQAGRCLPGAFRAYVQRIPLEGRGTLEQVWQAVRMRPFDADTGGAGNAGAYGDDRCAPAQRSRIWPDTMNCWEAAAHWTAAAQRQLPEGFVIHIWDRDLPNGARHVWPSLVTPDGRHVLVDLQTVAARDYSPRGYEGRALPAAMANAGGAPANDWYNDLLGVVHVAGKTVLSVFGLGKVGETLEEIEGDALPEWAQTNPKREDETPSAEADSIRTLLGSMGELI